MRNIIVLIPLFLILGGSIWLQILLSKKRNKWLGLILPVLNFIFSLSAIFPLFQEIVLPRTEEQYDEYGNLILATIIQPSGGIFSAISIGFLVYNISTFIFVLIYCIFRNKQKQQQEK